MNLINKCYQYLITTLAFKNKHALKNLSYLLKNSQESSEEACFLYYRLGMYRSVIQHPYDGRGFRGRLAKVIAYSAVGDESKVSFYLNSLLEDLNISDVLLAKLACEISPYFPEKALSILDDIGDYSLFKLAILIKVGQIERAKKMLIKLENKEISTELFRLQLSSNINSKILYLNRFFERYNLESVMLKDEQKMLSAHNIISAPEGKLSFEKSPLVTILITAYNSERYLGTAIESLLKQTYSNIEILIIDDASTDSTLDVIKQYSQQDSRLKYIALKENVGTFVAKSKGLKESKGEFITCHDSDDWAHPRKIELQLLPLLKDNSLVATTSQWIRLQDDGKYYARKIFPIMRLNPASPLFRKKIVLERAGYWDQVRTGADSEFLERLKVIFGEDTIQSIQKPLTIGAHRIGSLMTDERTGYNKGYSKQRLEYWELWRVKHLLNYYDY